MSETISYTIVREDEKEPLRAVFRNGADVVLAKLTQAEAEAYAADENNPSARRAVAKQAANELYYTDPANTPGA